MHGTDPRSHPGPAQAGLPQNDSSFSLNLKEKRPPWTRNCLNLSLPRAVPAILASNELRSNSK